MEFKEFTAVEPNHSSYVRNLFKSDLISFFPIWSSMVKTVEGEKLVLGNVHRTDMGGYLCIASNGIPPSVSKRFDVHKQFFDLDFTDVTNMVFVQDHNSCAARRSNNEK
ncbi:hypothetical protein GQX74_009141 [Glossina fuscipes]|nr:hypothetical protein GQX74_009141 [Glossina fuscipes]